MGIGWGEMRQRAEWIKTEGRSRMERDGGPIDE